MNWLERLNAQTARPMQGARVLRWSYSAHLADNLPHRHTYCEVCLVGRRGSAQWSIGGAQTAIGAGDVIFARPGAIHQISQTRELELFWVSFDPQNSATGAEIGALWRAFENSACNLAPDGGALLSIWLALQSVAGGEEIAGRAAQIEALQGALLLAIAQLGAGSSAPPGQTPETDAHGIARLAARYLQDNLGRKIALGEVAAHVHLSPRHLGRVFADFTGVSPAAYLETARLDRARHLLRSTNRPIKEIAAAVGFEDVHYFTRLFSKRNGAPPAQFRRNGGAGGAKIHKDGALI